MNNFILHDKNKMIKKCRYSKGDRHWVKLNNTSIYRKHDMPIQVSSIIVFLNKRKYVRIEPAMKYHPPITVIYYKDSKCVEFFKDGYVIIK